MKILITALLVVASCALQAQNTIYSHAVGNWRSGPVVYITPLIETSEAFTTAQLVERYRETHPELRDAKDIDVLRFATADEGEESRRSLKAKYGMRKLEVVMLVAPEEQDREQTR